jgi:hypothetical protein
MRLYSKYFDRTVNSETVIFFNCLFCLLIQSYLIDFALWFSKSQKLLIDFFFMSSKYA